MDVRVLERTLKLPRNPDPFRGKQADAMSATCARVLSKITFGNR
jgi:hypothetical protein